MKMPAHSLPTLSDRQSAVLVGPALDSWWLTLRRPPRTAWKSDPRMCLVEAGGHSVRVLDAGGSQPTVLLVCDAPVVLEHYLPLARELAPHARVVVFEMPGFGFSRPARSYRFTLAEQVDAVLALMDALSIARATVAFSCVNGLIAVAIAARAPARVAGLVLTQVPGVSAFHTWAARIDPKLFGRRLLAQPILGQAMMWAAPGWFAKQWFKNVSGPDADSGALAATAARVYGAGGAFCLASLNQALAGVTPAALPPFAGPLTIVWGGADRSHRKTDRRSSLEYGAHATVVELPGAGHCVDIEQPRAFAEIVLRSLGQGTTAG